jgi:hypothetical protein
MSRQRAGFRCDLSDTLLVVKISAPDEMTDELLHDIMVMPLKYEVARLLVNARLSALAR